jgi:GTP-binding protein
MAFRREKYVPMGGPSGGDGGHGGAVVLLGDENLNTLFHLRFRQLYAAERGRHGEGSSRTGKSGDDLVIQVPLGTQVYDAEGDALVGEILDHGERLIVAHGGRGGRGNEHFKSSVNQAPRRVEEGQEGEERHLRLELKLLADVGLVGLPNAGKSTLISRLSAARPKIAEYPFTTLVPQLGMVDRSTFRGGGHDTFVIADLPGLIAGAAEGAGLGHQFLRHVERCRVLVHLVDLSALPDDPSLEGDGSGAVDDLTTIEAELEAFDPRLLERPRLLVGSKADAAREERREALSAAARERKLPYFEISSVAGDGLPELVDAIADRLEEVDRESGAKEKTDDDHPWRPWER